MEWIKQQSSQTAINSPYINNSIKPQICLPRNLSKPPIPRITPPTRTNTPTKPRRLICPNNHPSPIPIHPRIRINHRTPIHQSPLGIWHRPLTLIIPPNQHPPPTIHPGSINLSPHHRHLIPKNPNSTPRLPRHIHLPRHYRRACIPRHLHPSHLHRPIRIPLYPRSPHCQQIR